MTLKEILGNSYRDGMTLEEVDEALGSVELSDNSSELERLKAALDRSNSEAAKYKRELREKMSADEIKAKEDAEKHDELQAKYDALVKKMTIADNKAKLLGIGYDEKLADETAVAMANGEIDKVIANQKKHLEFAEKKLRAEILKDTPKPEGGNSNVNITQEQFDNMSYSEQTKLFNENRELYDSLSNGGN